MEWYEVGISLNNGDEKIIGKVKITLLQCPCQCHCSCWDAYSDAKISCKWNKKR